MYLFRLYCRPFSFPTYGMYLFSSIFFAPSSSLHIYLFSSLFPPLLLPYMWYVPVFVHIFASSSLQNIFLLMFLFPSVLLPYMCTYFCPYFRPFSFRTVLMYLFPSLFPSLLIPYICTPLSAPFFLPPFLTYVLPRPPCRKTTVHPCGWPYQPGWSSSTAEDVKANSPSS